MGPGVFCFEWHESILDQLSKLHQYILGLLIVVWTVVKSVWHTVQEISVLSINRKPPIRYCKTDSKLVLVNWFQYSQWRIQDFLEGCVNLLFGQKFGENCMKMTLAPPPLDPPMGTSCGVHWLETIYTKPIARQKVLHTVLDNLVYNVQRDLLGQ